MFRETTRGFITGILILLLLTAGCNDSDDVFTGGGSLEGVVNAPWGAHGTIYVLAIARTDMGRLREMETRVPLLDSEYIAGFDALPASGPYRISGLAAGDYALWAWCDVDGDQAVDHKSFAEPVGWYQTTDNLFFPAAELAENGRVQKLDIELVRLTPITTGPVSVASGNGGGRLHTLRGTPVLHLWGTGVERAYAMGRLIAPQICEWINYVLVEHYSRSAEFYENSFLATVNSNFSGLDTFKTELEALLAGMRASGKDLSLPHLDREVSLLDLYGVNSFYAMPNTRIFGPSPLAAAQPLCSSAVVWGNWTETGELIHAKNMDGENDYRKITVNDLMLIAVEPAATEGLMRTVALDWPGFLGMDWGMNEAGLVTAPHSVLSGPDWEAADMLGYAMSQRKVLQAAATPQQAEALWFPPANTFCGGWNLAISGPALNGDPIPSVTFETDSWGGAIRYPGQVEPSYTDAILTTNTFFSYSGAQPAALLPDSYSPAPTEQNHRYRDMQTLLERYAMEGRPVGQTEIIDLMRAASRSAQYQGITEYSVTAWPDRMRLDLAREDLTNRILDASYATYETYGFAELFQRPNE